MGPKRKVIAPYERIDCGGEVASLEVVRSFPYFDPYFDRDLPNNSATSKGIRYSVRVLTSSLVPTGSFPEQYTVEQFRANKVKCVGRYKNEAGDFIVQSWMSPAGASIETPFNDLISIGFEMALYQCLYQSTLTLYASAYVDEQGTLVLALGKSNSGKSTFLNHRVKLDRQKRQAISDDHISLRVKNNHLLAFCPIWDAFYSKNQKPIKIRRILFVILDNFTALPGGSEAESLQFYLASRTVCFGFDKKSSELILKLLNALIYLAEWRALKGAAIE